VSGTTLPGALGRVTPRAGLVAHRFDLDSPAIDAGSARALLTAEEIARAEGYARDEDRRRRLAARALLRLTLAEALGRSPTALVFATGAHGKPSLTGAGLAFSLSHSAERLLIAVSRAGEVGADVERRGVARDLDAAARFAFTAEEQAALAPLSGPARERGFLRLWTAKEAALKALGVGMQRPMRDVVLPNVALDTLAAEAWSPEEARFEDRPIALFEVSGGGEVGCVALPAQSGANSAG
jgi:4'-phosphopantetheinyl transferase